MSCLAIAFLAFVVGAVISGGMMWLTTYSIMLDQQDRLDAWEATRWRSVDQP